MSTYIHEIVKQFCKQFLNLKYFFLHCLFADGGPGTFTGSLDSRTRLYYGETCMFIYAGIDEAGYGPTLGPLVITSTTFIIDNPDYRIDPPGSLWDLLEDAVCGRITDEAKRIPINDSKLLYSAAMGLGHLERGILSFLSTLGHEPRPAAEIFALLGYDEESKSNDREWYYDAEGWPGLPVGCKPELLESNRAALAACMNTRHVRLADIKSAVVFEERFNALLDKYENKAKASWSFVAGHLRNIWDTYGEQNPYVVVDRQGGRRYYEEVLSAFFPRTIVGVAEDTPAYTRYRIIGGGKRMDVTLQTESEQFHLPVALASMTAKYLRELMMMRFPRYWPEKAPEVKLSFGSFADGRRFVEGIGRLL